MSRNPEYDVTLDGVGLILTRDGLGVSRVQANPYAMKSSTGERTYADLDEWAVFQVSSCHRGMGQERYGDPEQFWYATRIDTRFKDKIFLGPRHLPIILNDESSPKVGNMHYAHLDDKFFCGCDDIVYELFHTYTASTIAFVNSTKKITDSADGLVNFVTGDTITVSGSTDNDGSYTIATGAVAGEIVVTEDLTDEDAGASVTISKYPNWIVSDEQSDEDITDMVAFDDYLYVARGSGNVIRKTDDGASWTDMGGDREGIHLYVHGGFLYQSDGNSVYYCANPQEDSPTWSVAIPCGSLDYDVESMVTYQNSLIVFKNDGAWRIPGNPGDLDKGYRVPELDWRTMISATNGRSSCVWSDGFLYVTAGSGILRWTGRTVTPVGIDLLLTGAIKGVACDLLPMTSSLFCYVNDTNGTYAYVLAWNGSGWHHLVTTTKAVTNANAKLYYHDGYLYTGHDSASVNTTERALLPTETQDPTQDSNYAFLDFAYGGGYFYSSKFTANLHDAQKEFRSFYIWLDNLGQGAVSGTQQVVVYYRIDSDNDSHWITLGTHSVADGGKAMFITNFPSGDFTEKTIASIDSDNDTITLATGDVVTDITTVSEWIYVVDTNEYRQVVSKTTGPPATITLQCPLDSAPTAGTIIRPGIPMGRFIQFQFYLVGSTTRTPAVLAWGLKYLVNISDYDIWQLNVQVSDPITLRNGNLKRQPIFDQLTRLNEIRRKGRVAFVDEVGESHTVKISNFSLQPVKQRTDARSEPIASYAAKLTLLEV